MQIACIERFASSLGQKQLEWTSGISTMRHKHEVNQLVRPPSATSDGRESAPGKLMQEHSTLLQTMGMVDESLQNASHASELLRRQSESISSFGSKLSGMGSAIPGISSILARINNRQFQERIVLGLVVGACLCILIWMRILR